MTVIENHQAAGINIFNSGTINGNVIVIGREQATVINETLKAATEPMTAAETVALLDEGSDIPVLVEDSRLAELTGPQTMTAFSVGDRWYGRIEGMSEGLFPLRLPSRPPEALANGARYHWEGTVRRDLRGTPSAIDVKTMTPA